MAESHSESDTVTHDGIKNLSAAAVKQTDGPDDDSQETREAFLASFSPEEEKRIMRIVDFRLLILFGVIYMVKQIDVNNASSVKVLAVGKPTNILTQLKMTADEYNWVQSLYYISYIIFELPSNLLLKKWTPRIFQARIMFLWGLVLACHAAVSSKAGILTARFFLGFMEAGLFPAIMTQLCSWYRSDEMGKPIAWLFGIFNLAGIIGSLIIYGVAFLDGRQGLSSWQWVFLLQGVATMAFAFLVWFICPDYPLSKRTGKWLTPREQKFVELRLAANAPLTSDAAFSSKESVDTLKDPRLWAFMLTQVLMNTGGFGLSWFLPTIITNLGFVGLPRNILLLVPTAAAAIFGISAAAFIQKKAWIPRPLFTICIVILEVATFAIFIATRSRGAIYTACILGTMFSASFAIPFWSWRTSSLKGTTGTAFAFGLQSGVGQLGGVIGPQIFQSKYAADGYRVPYAICTATIGGGLIGCLLCWYLTHKLEDDVRRVRKERIQAEQRGELYTGPDFNIDA